MVLLVVVVSLVSLARAFLSSGDALAELGADCIVTSVGAAARSCFTGYTPKVEVL